MRAGIPRQADAQLKDLARAGDVWKQTESGRLNQLNRQFSTEISG